MKKIFFLAAAMLLTITAFAEVMPASDSRVTYVGRTLVEGNDVSFDWTATYFRLSFSGKALTMRVSLLATSIIRCGSSLIGASIHTLK